MLEISKSTEEKNAQLEHFGIQLYSALEAQQKLADFSEEAVAATKQRLAEFVKKNYSRLQSESCIFGTVTFEVLPRDVAIVAAFSQAKGVALQELSYEKPLRRNTVVSMTFFSGELGIIYTPL